MAQRFLQENAAGFNSRTIQRANAYIIGVTSGAWVVVFVWFSTAFSAAALRLRVSFAFLAASLRFFAAALRFRVSLAFFAALLLFFAAILAFLVPAALIPAARCFLVAAAFFAAALRFDPLFMVWEVYSFRHPAEGANNPSRRAFRELPLRHGKRTEQPCHRTRDSLVESG